MEADILRQQKQMEKNVKQYKNSLVAITADCD